MRLPDTGPKREVQRRPGRGGWLRAAGRLGLRGRAAGRQGKRMRCGFCQPAGEYDSSLRNEHCPFRNDELY